jgi:SNF2-related domain
MCLVALRAGGRWSLKYISLFCCHRWGYAVLDEGHRIRNPDADVTLMAKQLQTVHRCHAQICILSSLKALLARHTLQNDHHAAE